MSNNSKLRMGMGAPGIGGLLKDGFKHFSGVEEAILRNIEACKQMSAITKTSYGPNGMNKLVINHLEKVFITSNTSTIVEQLEVEHPAAKLLCMAAQMQEQEAGDGTNYVVTFAGELLEHAETLIREGVHVSDIVEGYRRAAEETMKHLDQLVVRKIEDMRDVRQVTDALRSVIAAKHFGYEDFLAPLIAEACVHVMPSAPRKPSINVDNVRVAKMIGCSVGDSQVVRGLVVQRDAEGTIKHVEDAKIAVFGTSIEASSTETKGTVVIRNAEELKSYNKGEERRMEEAIKAVADTGAKVIVAGGSISEMAMHFIEKYNMLAVKIISKFELRRLCRSIGATACARLGAPMPEELGHARSVNVQELSGRRVLVFQQDEDERGLATIVLRGSTMNLLDDMERAINDCVNVVKMLCREPRLLPGAGATEMALAHHIGRVGEACPGLEQYAIKKFAEALEVFPRTLAENSGQRATDVVSALYSAHAAGNRSAGVNVVGGKAVADADAAAVLDSYYVRKESLRLSIDAAMTVLKVDQIIMSKKAGGPKPRAQQAPDM